MNAWIGGIDQKPSYAVRFIAGRSKIDSSSNVVELVSGVENKPTPGHEMKDPLSKGVIEGHLTSLQ